MNSIHVLHVVGNSQGGGTSIAVNIAGRLDPARFTAALAAPASTSLAAVCQRAGVRFLPLPVTSRRIAGGTPAALRDHLMRERPALVHAHGTRAAWNAAHALRAPLASTPLIYSEHLFSFDARRGLPRVPWLVLERALCGRATAVTTSCATNATHALRARWLPSERLRLTHYGIDLVAIRAQVAQPAARSAIGVPASAPLVGTVGRLIPQKGLRYLLAATPLVLSSAPDAHVLVVGDGMLRDALTSQCAALGIKERVHFYGASEAPWHLLAACDVIALPSLYEGLPLTALEAVAAGKPVVATDVGGTAEVIIDGRTGLLVPPRDVGALARALVQLLSRPEERARMSHEAAAVVAPYDLAPVVLAFSHLYQELGSEAQRGAR
jgi:glycosyltransferase involved in cell wall biosynthesis